MLQLKLMGHINERLAQLNPPADLKVLLEASLNELAMLMADRVDSTFWFSGQSSGPRPSCPPQRPPANQPTRRYGGNGVVPMELGFAGSRPGGRPAPGPAERETRICFKCGK